MAPEWCTHAAPPPSTMSDPKQTAKGFVIASEWAGEPVTPSTRDWHGAEWGGIICLRGQERSFQISLQFFPLSHFSLISCNSILLFIWEIGNFFTPLPANSVQCGTVDIICTNPQREVSKRNICRLHKSMDLQLLYQSWLCFRGWLSRKPKRTECRQRKRINKWTMATGALPLPSFKIKESQGLIGSACPWKLVDIFD